MPVEIIPVKVPGLWPITREAGSIKVAGILIRDLILSRIPELPKNHKLVCRADFLPTVEFAAFGSRMDNDACAGGRTFGTERFQHLLRGDFRSPAAADRLTLNFRKLAVADRLNRGNTLTFGLDSRDSGLTGGSGHIHRARLNRGRHSLGFRLLVGIAVRRLGGLAVLRLFLRFGFLAVLRFLFRLGLGNDRRPCLIFPKPHMRLRHLFPSQPPEFVLQSTSCS